jgi:hypothetical protein
MRRVVLTIAGIVALGACTAAPSPAPTPIWQTVDGVRLACDPTPSPGPPSCEAALGTGLPASGHATSDIDFVEYHFGTYCPAGGPCPSAPPTVGYLVFHLRGGSADALLVTMEPDGTVFAAPPAPFPPPTQPVQ